MSDKLKCRYMNRVAVHDSITIGGSSIGECGRECLPGMVVCQEHTTPDAIAMLVKDLYTQVGVFTAKAVLATKERDRSLERIAELEEQMNTKYWDAAREENTKLRAQVAELRLERDTLEEECLRLTHLPIVEVRTGLLEGLYQLLKKRECCCTDGGGGLIEHCDRCVVLGYLANRGYVEVTDE